jgi:hypothetical protein
VESCFRAPAISRRRQGTSFRRFPCIPLIGRKIPLHRLFSAEFFPLLGRVAELAGKPLECMALPVVESAVFRV